MYKTKEHYGKWHCRKKREMCTEKRAFNNIQKSAFQYKNLYPLNGEKIEKKNIFFTARHKNECNWQKTEATTTWIYHKNSFYLSANNCYFLNQWNELDIKFRKTWRIFAIDKVFKHLMSWMDFLTCTTTNFIKYRME